MNAQAPTRAIKVALVGASGYGNLYLQRLCDRRMMGEAKLVAAVDIRPPHETSLELLKANGSLLLSSLEHCFDFGQIDLVVLANPIHLHARDSILALWHGAHVLCEKPAAGSSVDFNAMVDASREVGRWISVGFQWSFSQAMSRCRAFLATRRMGRPLFGRARVYWPRPVSYYTRNSWAGRLRSADGRQVNDSPVSNATAHYLQALFSLVSAATLQPVEVDTVAAMLWRAFDIETFDSTAASITTKDGVRITFCTTHASECEVGPDLELCFENGVLKYTKGEGLQALCDGECLVFGDPEYEDPMQKLHHCLEAVSAGTLPLSPIDETRAHVEVVERLSSLPVEMWPQSNIAVREVPGCGKFLTARGMEETLDEVFESSFRL
ncbi:MAG: Gfo/Idh/MocA family oxidoreductase [Opitutaceae bacterium]|nr:Gfo/Idh/MocA family oxidoreductase [Opitutaceae bacterium]